ncbi:hypothetical protein [Kitasatospora sp. NPDC087315]|uniref:hypothetical protein n=1 Tax=Kitasatospora sp. NPDC087315 TaxID=3364069 RepID=UPI0038145EE7
MPYSSGPPLAVMPGAEQVYRGPGCTDTVALRDDPAPEDTIPLLETVMSGGERTAARPPLARARAAFETDLARLPAGARRINAPQPPAVAVSGRLRRHTGDVRRLIENRLRAGQPVPRAVRPSRMGPDGPRTERPGLPTVGAGPVVTDRPADPVEEP